MALHSSQEGSADLLFWQLRRLHAKQQRACTILKFALFLEFKIASKKRGYIPYQMACVVITSEKESFMICDLRVAISTKFKKILFLLHEILQTETSFAFKGRPFFVCYEKIYEQAHFRWKYFK
jgi:hypothetical protein